MLSTICCLYATVRLQAPGSEWVVFLAEISTRVKFPSLVYDARRGLAYRLTVQAPRNAMAYRNVGVKLLIPGRECSNSSRSERKVLSESLPRGDIISKITTPARLVGRVA